MRNSPVRRGFEIGTNSKFWAGSRRQLETTFRKPKKESLVSEKKPALCFVPGWSTDLNSYQHLTEELEEDFDILPLQNFPEGFRAIFSRLSIYQQTDLLLQTLKNAEAPSNISVVGHSNGGVVATFAKILANERIGKIVTLSSPLSGSTEVARLPIVSSWARAVRDLSPESAVMGRILEEGNVSDRFVAQKDELFKPQEMAFPNGKEHQVDHGHFDYMVGTRAQIKSTAVRIKDCLINLPTT